MRMWEAENRCIPVLVAGGLVLAPLIFLLRGQAMAGPCVSEGVEQCRQESAPPPVLRPIGEEILLGGYEFSGIGSGVAVASDGAFAAGWEGFFCCMHAKSFKEDGSVGSEFDLGGGGSASAPPIAMASLPDGSFAVVWSGFRPDLGFGLFYQRFSFEGDLLAGPTQVFFKDPGEAEQPAMDVLSDGALMLAWSERSLEDGSQSNLYAAYTVADGSSYYAARVNTHDTGSHLFPSVSAGPNSEFVVAWRGSSSPGTDSDGTSVQGRRYGAGWSEQFQVNVVTTGDQRNPDVEMAPDGSFLVVWDGASSGTDQDRSVQGRYFDANGIPQGGEFQINSLTPGTQSDPAVESLSDGSFLVVWRTDEAVWGRRVSGNRVSFTPEQRLSVELDRYEQPSLAKNANGRWVVSWEFGDYGNTEVVQQVMRFQEDLVLFSDGFESGGTDRWTDVVPGQ